MRQQLGDVGYSHANRDFVAQKLADQGLSDAQIAENKEYKQAEKDDLAAMEIYNVGMQQISTILAKYGYTEAQIAENKKSVNEMFSYYRGLEYNFINNQVEVKKRKERKVEAGKVSIRLMDSIRDQAIYEKIFRDRNGGNINIGITTIMITMFCSLAQKAGFQAIVVGKIGSNGIPKLPHPLITIGGVQVKGQLADNVLYVDSDYFDKYGSAHSSFIRQIVVNRFATSVVSAVAKEFNLTSPEHATFYNTLAGVFGWQRGNSFPKDGWKIRNGKCSPKNSWKPTQ